MKTLHHFLTTNRLPLSLLLVLTILFGLNYVSAWNAPAGNPPINNVAAPINTSTAAQNKSGALSVNSLTTFGPSFIDSAAPTLKFTDTTAGHRDFWWHANENRMYLLADRNDNGTWAGEDPFPLYAFAGATPAEDYLTVSNQVRANAYCDRAGGNCWNPATGGGPGGGGGKVFHRCSNADSSNPANEPCFNAGNGDWDKRYRVVSCLYSEPRLSTTGDYLYFNGTNWMWVFRNGKHYQCRDNTVVVMDVEAGGGGGLTPPVCAGNNQALGWNGTDWLCNTMTSGNAAVIREWRDFSGLPARQFVTVYTNTESTPRPLRIRLTNNLNDNQASIFMRVNNGAPWVIMGSAPDVPGQVFNFDVPPGGSYAIDTRWNGNTCVGTSGASRPAGCNALVVQATNSSVTWEEQLPI